MERSVRADRNRLAVAVYGSTRKRCMEMEVDRFRTISQSCMQDFEFAVVKVAVLLQ